MRVPNKILEQIQKSESFLVHAHLSPDPDSLGSVLAFKLGLESIGKVVHLYCEDELPKHSLFLPENEMIRIHSMSEALRSYSFEKYVCLDTAKWALATHQEPLPEIRKPVINIDHHPDNQVKSTFSWVEPKSACAAQLVYEVLVKLDIVITPDIATCLIFGILGDTSIFQNFNTESEVLNLAAKLITS